MDKIKYTEDPVNPKGLKVYLGKKLAGRIWPFKRGFRYFPVSGSCGNHFDTIQECKRSIEGR